jgi:hypothetical protein
MNKYLYKFHWDCGRMGDLETLFVATEDEIKDLIGRDTNFGEVLGKHSEIYGTIEEKDITKIDLDPETVEKVSKILGITWSGYSIFDYVKYECPICGDKVRGEEWDYDFNRCNYCESEDRYK